MLADIRYVSVKDCVSEKVKITDNLEQGKQSFYPAIYCEWQIKITIYISWMTTQNHQQHIQHVSQHMELSVSTHPSACVKFRCSRTLSSTLFTHSLTHTLQDQDLTFPLISLVFLVLRSRSKKLKLAIAMIVVVGESKVTGNR